MIRLLIDNPSILFSFDGNKVKTRFKVAVTNSLFIIFLDDLEILKSLERIDAKVGNLFKKLISKLM
tara:strand:- start:79 stop:276 length:198 start_codon:yes stop_codon:yes gene_type:complete